MLGDPYAFAEGLGINVCWAFELPFLVGSSGENTVFYRWDSDPTVRAERAWEGIAQCIMTRAGVEWSAPEAALFAKKLRRLAPSQLDHDVA